MSRLFSEMRPFAPLAEAVVARVFAPGETATRSATIRAVVHFGSGLQNGVGPLVAPETGDGYVLSIARDAWPFPFPPAFGHRFEPQDYGTVIAKQVQPIPGGWTVRCDQNQRAESRA